eukprot:contig_21064_g5172
MRHPSSSTSQLFVLLTCSSLSTPLLSPLFLLRLRSGCHHGACKVHGSLSRAGKVRAQTPKVEVQEKPKKPKGRAGQRLKFNRAGRTPSRPSKRPLVVIFFFFYACCRCACPPCASFRRIVFAPRGDSVCRDVCRDGYQLLKAISCALRRGAWNYTPILWS